MTCFGCGYVVVYCCLLVSCCLASMVVLVSCLLVVVRLEYGLGGGCILRCCFCLMCFGFGVLLCIVCC